MTHKIMALIDGSVYSESVCHHAAWIAQKTSAPVELIHVLGRREAANNGDLSGAIRLGARSALMDELTELDAQRAKLISQRGRAILEDARAIVDNDTVETGGASKSTTRLRHGDLIETIAEIESDARVIVIGKRGEAADFAKGHLGSNLERMVRAAYRPILVAARSFKPIKNVLVAYDASHAAIKAIDHIAKSSFFVDLPVTIVTVATESATVRGGLADAKATLEAAGIVADTRIVAGQPDVELGKMVDEHDFHMLVMGAYGHSRIRSLAIGSTTTEMMRSCKVPVLLLR